MLPVCDRDPRKTLTGCRTRDLALRNVRTEHSAAAAAAGEESGETIVKIVENIFFFFNLSRPLKNVSYDPRANGSEIKMHEPSELCWGVSLLLFFFLITKPHADVGARAPAIM